MFFLCITLVCLALAAVNQAIRERRPSQTLRVLSLPEVALTNLMPHCGQKYQEHLTELMRNRACKGINVLSMHQNCTKTSQILKLNNDDLLGDNCSAWVCTELDDGTCFYFNLNKLEGTWEKPKDFIQNSLFLSHKDIQVRDLSIILALQFFCFRSF